MKKYAVILILLLCIILFSLPVFSQETQSYTVKPGDSMWKIAVKYEIGISELIERNPEVDDPSTIYPGQKVKIPNIDEIKTIEDKVIELVNSERNKRDLEPLKKNWQLSRVARYKSRDMLEKNYFSHTSPTYGSPFKMMEDFDLKFTAAGENIAAGQRTPEEVMNAWMNSPGHRKNILSSAFSEIGVGLAKGNGRNYWTQMFIRPVK